MWGSFASAKWKRVVSLSLVSPLKLKALILRNPFLLFRCSDAAAPASSPRLVLHISFLARMVRDDAIAGILSKSVINGALSTSQFSSVTSHPSKWDVQGPEIRYANFVKQVPGRARQNS